MNLEYKFAVEKAANDVADGYIKGIATTPKLDSYEDIIAVGAFAESIQQRGVTGPRAVKMLAQHDSGKVIGNWKSLKYEGEALLVEGQIDLTNTDGMIYYNHVKKDQIGSLSVGFTTQVRQWDEDNYVRTIIKGDLREISLVTFPANEDAMILDVKSEKDGEMKLSDLEKKLARDFGLSRKQSCGIIRVIKSSRLLASVPPVPAAGGTSPVVKTVDNVKSLQNVIADLKRFSAIDEIRRMTEELRG